jgi:hypothetical protein
LETLIIYSWHMWKQVIQALAQAGPGADVQA